VLARWAPRAARRARWRRAQRLLSAWLPLPQALARLAFESLRECRPARVAPAAPPRTPLPAACSLLAVLTARAGAARRA
jgi:hypothetical protein